MKLTFLGAAKTVTGSKYLIEQGGRKILVDCGLFQGLKKLRQRNWNPLDVPANEIDLVLLTHAHIDHSGFLPRLVKDGFKGKIYCTEATCDLAQVLLPDCAHIMEEDARYANKKGFSKHSPALPLFDSRDVERTLNLFKPIKYETELDLNHDLFATFIDAGHILGSSSILVDDKRKGIRIGFSGDLGRPNDPILHPPKHFENLNYLVVESTYGDRSHGTTEPLDDLSSVINEAYEKGGSIIIPAFAVGRTQSLLFHISILKKKGRIPKIPIYLNSPMATRVSDIYCRYSHDHYLSKDQCDDMCDAAEFVRTPDESIALNRKPSPMIIISASGMATGGRVLHHLRRFLPDERSTILFTGFQAAGTRGAKIVGGAKHIKIHGQEWPVNAKIINMNSMSAHADQGEILGWLKDSKINPKKVFVSHGEEVAAQALASEIEKIFSWKCVIPDLNDSYEL
ncbi:MAG: MBL fold metallo-hydrolase [Bdellovibrionales bacterium]|nr:MBL fold metallo-hydrolase [Bdellovibrionales bacterium]